MSSAIYVISGTKNSSNCSLFLCTVPKRPTFFTGTDECVLKYYVKEMLSGFFVILCA